MQNSLANHELLELIIMPTKECFQIMLKQHAFLPMCQNKWYFQLPWRYNFKCSSRINTKLSFYVTYFLMTSFISFQQQLHIVLQITHACFGKTIQELIGSLESESEVALNWFKETKMIPNLGKVSDHKYRKQKIDPNK